VQESGEQGGGGQARLAGNIACLTISGIAGSLCLFLANLAIIRFYGKGIHDGVVWVVSMAGVLMLVNDLGLASKAGVRAIARGRAGASGDLSETVTVLAVVLAAAGAALAVGLIALAGPLARLRPDVTAASVRLAGTWVLAFAVVRIAMMVALGFQRAFDVLLLTVAVQAGKLACVLACGAAALEARWVLVGWTGVYVLAAALAIVRLRGLGRRFGLGFVAAAVTVRRAMGQLRRAGPYYVWYLGAFAVFPVTALLIGAFHGSGAGQISLFQVGFVLALASRLLSVPIATALFPAVAGSHAGPGTDRGDTAEVLGRLTRLLAVAATGLYAAYWAGGGPLLAGLYGDGYAGALPVLLILAVAVGAESCAQPFDQVLMATGRAGVVAWLEGGKYLLLVGAGVLWIPAGGAVGAAVAAAMALLAPAVAKAALARRQVGPAATSAFALSLTVYAVVTGVGLAPFGASLVLPVWLAGVLALRLLRPREAVRWPAALLAAWPRRR